MPSHERIVNIRRNIENYGDPYLAELKPHEVAICRECRAVYSGQRWELESKARKDLDKSTAVDTLCPACRKVRDRMPGGITTLSGKFVTQHENEIVNLINHENERAMEINPLERIIDIERSDDALVVLTTNEKLAQKIGRAVHKAYSGSVEYKWSEDTKLARVHWHRD